MGTSDGGEAGSGAPQPNRIEVHVHQESGLAKLLLSGCSLLQPLILQPRTASQTLGSSRLLVASWVSRAACLVGCGRGPGSLDGEGEAPSSWLRMRSQFYLLPRL